MTTIEEKDVIITRGKKRLVIRKPVQAPAVIQVQQVQAPAVIQVQQVQAPAVIQVQQVQAPAVIQTAVNKIDQYISQLSAQEKIVFKIAQEHLESSFDMEKSIGYKEWLLKN